jgi:hypothetical protein
MIKKIIIKEFSKKLPEKTIFLNSKNFPATINTEIIAVNK